jgi:hypothetical protein
VSPRRIRSFVGALVCVVLPIGSWGISRGSLAYTMYATTVVFRLEVVGYDPQGHLVPLSPSELARHTSPFAAGFFFGAEEPRELPQIDALRAHLADVGRLGCDQSSSARVEVTLFEGPGASGPPSRGALSPSGSASVACEAR